MAKKVLMVINDAGFFLSHRYDLAQGLKQAGYEVMLACPAQVAIEKITALGFPVYTIPLTRRGLNPFEQLKLIASLYKLYQQLKPDVIHHFSIKPIIFGSIATKWKNQAKVINAPTGLGYLFSNDKIKAKILRQVALLLYRFALTSKKISLIFQNKDDKQLFIDLGLAKHKKVFLIKGAGVNLQEYLPLPEPAGKPVVIFPARLLWDKGLQEFIDAVSILRQKQVAADFVLVGDVDTGNPATASKEILETWVQQGLVQWWGWQKDMADVFHRTHIVCLPSYREGIPKVLLEACACAKPIITTDAPGCREVVQDQVNGFLVPVKNATLLADRIQELVESSTLRQQMGLEGLALARTEFAAENIVKQTLQAYTQVLSAR